MITSEKIRAAREAWAVGPAEAPAFLRATGKDAKDYLHRMTTQAVNPVPPGGAGYTAVLNAKGHLLADAHFLVEPDAVLLVMDAGAAVQTRDHLEKFVIMDEVELEDLSASLRIVPVLGPAAPDPLPPPAGEARAFANGRRGPPARDLVVPADRAEAVRAALAAAGAAALDAPDLEALRILDGLARFGADMDASRLPMEAGLTRAAIDFRKGCYTGQEVVLRATVRGHLQRGLVQLSLPAGAGAGTTLSAGGKEVGSVTSAAETPEGRVGLGYVRRAHWKEGERLSCGGAEAVVRRVIVEDGVAC